MMDKTQRQVLEQSYVQVFARKAELATRFYDHLFAADPGLRALFSKDMFMQREMFASILVLILKHASRPETFHDLGGRLAAQHAKTGVTYAQYALAVDAFVAAMRDVLGATLLPEVEQAWQAAMQDLVSHMAPDMSG